MKNFISLTVAYFIACLVLLSAASAANVPALKESFASPGAASELVYSGQYGLLFLRNSGSAVRVVDTNTHAQIDLRLANAQFTDMDLTPDGKYLFVADWGHVATGYGTLTSPHYVQRYNLETRQWEVKQSLVDSYKIEAVDANRVILLESDQWVDIHLEQWTAASALTTLASTSMNYYGDIEYDPATGRVYHGNSGSSSSEIDVRRLVGNTFQSGVGTGTYGSAQSGGGTSVLSPDGTRFYFGKLQVEGLDVTNNIHTFPQAIYAASNDIAFGSSAYYNAMTGDMLGGLGYSTTVYALNPSGSELWTYYNNTLYHYSVPEPSTLLLGALAITTCASCAVRRRLQVRACRRTLLTSER